MQADYTLLREIMHVCVKNWLLPVCYDALQKQLWFRAEPEIRDHVLMLERGD